MRETQRTEHGVIARFGVDFMSGAVAAAIAKTVMAPIERAKLLLQLQNAQVTMAAGRRYTGLVDCLMRVPGEQGFLSFWRGNYVSVVRGCAQESLGFGLNNFFKQLIVRDEWKHNKLKLLAGNVLAGGCAGVGTYCVIYPLDLVRTRLAMDIGRGETREFRGITHCATSIARHDGIRGLYRGFATSLAYIFVYRSIFYGLYDSSRAFLSEDPKKMNFFTAFVVANFVTFTAGMVAYPLDTVRRRMMMQSGKATHAYSSALECIKIVARDEGLMVLYKGAWVNAMRGIGNALILALYSEMGKYTT